MKQLIFLTLALLVLSLMTPVVLSAQQASPQLFVVFEEHVTPSDHQQYMVVQKEAVDLWHKHNLDLSIYAYETDDNSVYWVMPIRNFASLDTIFQKTSAFLKKIKQEGYDGDKKFRNLSTLSQTVIMWDPELSFHPNGRFGEPGKNYEEWMFVSLHSGHDEEAQAIIKKYIDFYTNHNVDYSWDTFRVLLGNDTPGLIMMTSNENPVSQYTREAEIMKAHRQELDKLWNEFISHVRKTEVKTGWFSPSLSHQPQ